MDVTGSRWSAGGAETMRMHAQRLITPLRMLRVLVGLMNQGYSFGKIQAGLVTQTAERKATFQAAGLYTDGADAELDCDEEADEEDLEELEDDESIGGDKGKAGAFPPSSVVQAVDEGLRLANSRRSAAHSALHRLAEIRSYAAVVSRQWARNASTVFSEDGQFVQYGPARVSMADLRTAAAGAIAAVHHLERDMFGMIGLEPPALRLAAVVADDLGDREPAATSFPTASLLGLCPDLPGVVFAENEEIVSVDETLMRPLLDIEERFLVALAVAILLTSGPNTRAQELLRARWMNSAGGRRSTVRVGESLYLQLAVLKGPLAPAPRLVLKPLQAEIAVVASRYLMWLRPTTSKLVAEMHREPPSAYLFRPPGSKRRISGYRVAAGLGALFPNKGVNVARYRQLSLAVIKRKLLPELAHLLAFGADDDEEPTAAVAAAAGTSVAMVKNTYGVAMPSLPQLDPYRRLVLACRAWNSYLGVSPPAPPSDGDGASLELVRPAGVAAPLRPTAGAEAAAPMLSEAGLDLLIGRLESAVRSAVVDERLLGPPGLVGTCAPPASWEAAPAALQRALYAMAGKRRPRAPVSLQAAAAIAAGTAPALALALPAGFGKTAVLLSSCAPEVDAPGLCTVYLAPYVALVEQVERFLAAQGVSGVRWTARLPTCPTGARVLLATWDAAASPAFLAYYLSLLSRRRIARVVLDEAHAVGTEDFRLQSIAPLARITAPTSAVTGRPPVVLASGSLPPTLLPLVVRRLALPEPIVLREPCMRANLRWVRAPGLSDDTLVDVALQLSQAASTICFVPRKAMAETLARAACKRAHQADAAVHYHARPYAGGQEEVIAPALRRNLELFAGGHVRLVFSTSALACGVDVAGVSNVLIRGPFDCDLLLAQMGARAARAEGEQGLCLLCPAPAEAKPGIAGQHGCIRHALTAAIDGVSSSCFEAGPGVIVCSACEPDTSLFGPRAPLHPALAQAIGASQPTPVPADEQEDRFDAEFGGDLSSEELRELEQVELLSTSQSAETTSGAAPVAGLGEDEPVPPASAKRPAGPAEPPLATRPLKVARRIDGLEQKAPAPHQPRTPLAADDRRGNMVGASRAPASPSRRASTALAQPPSNAKDRAPVKVRARVLGPDACHGAHHR